MAALGGGNFQTGDISFAQPAYCTRVINDLLVLNANSTKESVMGEVNTAVPLYYNISAGAGEGMGCPFNFP